MVTKETAHAVNARLSTIYGKQWSPDQGSVLWDEFKDLIDDAAFKKAVGDHVHSDTGQYPPKPADVERHLVAIHAERMRKKQAAEAKRRQEESDATYTQAMDSPKWRQEIELGKAIRSALVAEFKLDEKKPEDMQFIMRTLKICQGETGLCSVEEALGIAENEIA